MLSKRARGNPALHLLRRGSLRGSLRGGHASLAFASQVRRNTQHALDQHKLAAVVHLMLLHARQHVETRAAGRSSARRQGYALAQEVVWQRLDRLGILLTLIFE